MNPNLETCVSTDGCGSHLLQASDVPPRRARQVTLINRLNTRCVLFITAESLGRSGSITHAREEKSWLETISISPRAKMITFWSNIDHMYELLDADN